MPARDWLRAFCVAVLVAVPAMSTSAQPRTSESHSYVDAINSAELIEDAGLHNDGFGRISMRAIGGHTLSARTYRATGFQDTNGPIWFVMHGVGRNADRYVRIAAPVAERHGALAIVLEFAQDEYPRSSDYTLGVTGSDRFGSAGWRRWSEPQDTVYVEVERAFEVIRRTLLGNQPGYFMFGHSAGAQFTHRLLTFLPEARVIRAVAANAGWYTMPIEEHARDHAMPYGLAGGPVRAREMTGLFDASLVIMLGERDTATASEDRSLRGTTQAQAQGANRFTRGRHYFDAAAAQADALDTELRWRHAIVPHADHDAAKMIDSAALFLFDSPDDLTPPAVAAEAQGLVVTEILADPPKGAAGDSNGDGARDAQDDEFVELMNTGQDPIHLSGWTLGDASNHRRHVFPLGTVLSPGAKLVVFGGGVPTGSFSGAVVQWAENGLGLTNAGDVLTISDAQGSLQYELSWGDASRRAADHWDGSLELNSSIVRSAHPEAHWQPHRAAHGACFSPGE